MGTFKYYVYEDKAVTYKNVYSIKAENREEAHKKLVNAINQMNEIDYIETKDDDIDCLGCAEIDNHDFDGFFKDSVEISDDEVTEK